MSLKIDDFKAKLTGGGARANYFEVEIPRLGNTDDRFMIKAASMPSSVIAPMTVPFRGRQLQVAGDRTFEPWTVTVINDTDMRVRADMERWMSEIQSHVSNNAQNSDPASYMSDAKIIQLNRDGTNSRSYDFKGIWPSNISAIDVSYDSENTIEEFTVEFQITYWTSEDSTDRSGAA